MGMKILVVGCLFAISLCANGQSTKTGPATASGGCAVSHSGNNDTIVIKNCGIGEEQGKKIVVLLKAALANRDLNSVNNKLDELIALANKPSETQICVGSACAQGAGSQATYNQFGAPKLVMTDAQRDAIRDAMKPFAGGKVNISISLAEPDSGEYGRQLVSALKSAGMIVEHSEAWSLVVAGAPASGVSFAFTEDHRAVAEALGLALQTVGSAHAPIRSSIYPTSEQTPQSFFSIVVQPNR
jgi:hypothetical protein